MLVVMREEGDIEVSDLPQKLLNPRDSEPSSPCYIYLPMNGINFNEMVSQFEKDLLLQALRKSSGIKKRAAKLLNLNRTTLVEKLKRYKLTEAELALNED
jgi:transcriptional regulator of acetoin/glycerol metabolism